MLRVEALASWNKEARSPCVLLSRSTRPSKLRAEALDEFLASWEAEHGALTAAEISRAERELGMRADEPAA